MRQPIEEGLYEVETINLLADNDDIETKLKAIDRAEVILEWLDSFSRRQLRIYKEPVEDMVYTLKHIIRSIEKHVARQRRGSKNRN